jgi:hypothetical protein
MAKIRCFKCNENGHMRKDCSYEKHPGNPQSSGEEAPKITERVGMKCQRQENLITENEHESHQEVEHDRSQAVVERSKIITIEDSRVEDETPSTEVWQDEPQKNEMNFDGEGSDEENEMLFEDDGSDREKEYDSEEVAESRDIENMEDIEDQGISTVEIPSLPMKSGERVKEKQRRMTARPSDFRLGHRRTIVSKLRAATTHPKGKKKQGKTTSASPH